MSDHSLMNVDQEAVGCAPRLDLDRRARNLCLAFPAGCVARGRLIGRAVNGEVGIAL